MKAIFVILIILLSTSTSALAATFSSYQIEHGIICGGYGCGDNWSDQTTLRLGFGGPPDWWQEGATVFDIFLTENIVGRTYTASSGPEFDMAAEYLTNGINNSTWEAYDSSGNANGTLGGYFAPEALRFYGDHTGASGIDYVGLHIDSISLTINDFTVYTEEDPYYGERTNLYFAGIVTINASPVPIPAAAWLFGSALLGLFGIGRNRKQA